MSLNLLGLFIKQFSCSMQNNSIDSTIPNEWVTLFYEDKPIRIVIIDNKFSWTSVTDVIDALAYKTYRDGLRFLNEAVHFRKGEEIRLENGVLTQIDVINNSGIEMLIKYAKASFRKPFKEWYRVHLSLTNVDEIRALAQQPREESKEQSIDFQIFTFQEGDNIRVFLDEKGEPWFVVLDVCNALGHSNPSQAVNDHCEKDRLRKTEAIDSLGRRKEVLLVDEFNLYALILGSKKENASVFKKWVLGEVLPTIRKTGKYEIIPKQETNAIEGFTPAQIASLRQIIQEALQESEQRIEAKNEARVQPLETAIAYLMGILPALIPQQYEGEPSYCYLGQNADNLRCKIGKANLPPDRVWELEAGGSKINLLKTIKLPNEETAFFIEKFFHTLFAPFEEGREWYRLTKAHIDMFVKIADLLNAYYEDLMRRLEKKE
jgi:prophage antirepressor-like protein